MSDFELEGLMRTHHCGQLNKSDIGKDVILCGWVNKYRNLGSLHFIDIRDKYGLTQLGFEAFSGDRDQLKDFSLESIIWAKGVVKARPDSALNLNMPTGEIEVEVRQIKLLASAKTPPFLPHSKASEATEDLRLKYRYLDLRSKKLQNILSLRSDTAKIIRDILYQQNFTEVETPILYKTTPEGARDYIVPSRVHPGKVYALPQSPQTLKQLLMIGGTDKYFQICRCFRDEDLRADRQPEFTQVDIEVSFATPEYIKNLVTSIIKKVFNLPQNYQMPTMTYGQAMSLYGTDKPDLRFGLEHHNVTSFFSNSPFKVFKDVCEAKGLIKAIFIESSVGQLARKQIDALVDVVRPHGGQGVAWFKVESQNAVSGGISKFIDTDTCKKLQEYSDGKEGLWLFCAHSNPQVVHASADALRRYLGRQLNLINNDQYQFLWIDDFPLLEYDEQSARYFACHHPFTMPHQEDLRDFLEGKNLGAVRAQAYDVVCNGYEIAGGSMRIYDQNVQAQMFKVLGMSDNEVKEQFGFFVEALQYGTPPHGGVAFGMDRVIMLLAKTDSIRDVISFPKTTTATDLMAQAPSPAKNSQLEELGICRIKS